MNIATDCFKHETSWLSRFLIPRNWKIASSHFRAAKRVYTIGKNDRRDVKKIRVRNEPAIFRREDSPGFPGPLTNLLASKKAAWYASPHSVHRLCKIPVELPHVRNMTCAFLSLSLSRLEVILWNNFRKRRYRCILILFFSYRQLIY